MPEERKPSQSRIVIDRIDRKIEVCKAQVKENIIAAANCRNQYEALAIQVENLTALQSPTPEELAELKAKKAGKEEAHVGIASANWRRQQAMLDIRRYQAMHDWLVSNGLRSIPRRLHDSLLAADDRTLSSPEVLGDYIARALASDTAIAPVAEVPSVEEPAAVEPVVEESVPEPQPAPQPQPTPQPAPAEIPVDVDSVPVDKPGRWSTPARLAVIILPVIAVAAIALAILL